jgi:hypothetical protein
MEAVSTPYDTACNATLLGVYAVVLGSSVRVQCRYFNRSRFIQMIQYLVSMFYACSPHLGRVIDITVVFVPIPGLKSAVCFFASLILVFCAAVLVTYHWFGLPRMQVLMEFDSKWARRKVHIANGYAIGNVVVLAVHLALAVAWVMDSTYIPKEYLLLSIEGMWVLSLLFLLAVFVPILAFVFHNTLVAKGSLYYPLVRRVTHTSCILVVSSILRGALIALHLKHRDWTLLSESAESVLV